MMTKRQPSWCKLIFSMTAFASLATAAALRAQDLVQVHQDFSANPGWEAVGNRIEAIDPPTITQDFGWAPANQAGGKPAGAIGGHVAHSRTPAHYALPFGKPFTFNDAFSASGRIAVMPGETRGNGYIAFFNEKLQGWRPWSSVAIRLTTQEDGNMSMGVDYMGSNWGGLGMETDIVVPKDGKSYAWMLAYDPAAVRPAEWPHPGLKQYMPVGTSQSKGRRTDIELFELVRKSEPDLTLKQMQKRLQDTAAAGFLRFYNRERETFLVYDDYKNEKGLITLQFEGGPVWHYWMPDYHRNAPVILNRFGIFNFQLHHDAIEFYVSDLVVSGQKIDLSQDPGWEGRGNRVTFVQREFHRQDFGYSATNWAGKAIGEIGGLFYRTEGNDPGHGYYADDIGKLTLEDPFAFSGSICFVNGGTDAGMFFGYFNAAEKMKEFSDPRAANPLKATMGIQVAGPTRVGYWFSALCSPTEPTYSLKNGPVFLPTQERRSFKVTYDPKANDNVGRMTVTLDDETFHLDLKPKQRKAGATFDRFGIMNTRKGGKYVTIYFDDMEYTARRPANYKPVRHEQKIVNVPYPPDGRQY